MDLNRKIATGRFSELVGFEKGLRSDKFFRVLGFAQAAKNIFPMLNNETREALIAYTEVIEFAVKIIQFRDVMHTWIQNQLTLLNNVYIIMNMKSGPFMIPLQY